MLRTLSFHSEPSRGASERVLTRTLAGPLVAFGVFFLGACDSGAPPAPPPITDGSPRTHVQDLPPRGEGKTEGSRVATAGSQKWGFHAKMRRGRYSMSYGEGSIESVVNVQIKVKKGRIRAYLEDETK